MSAARATTAEPAAAPTGLLDRARWEVSDALVMTWRNLMRWVRLPQLVVVSTIQPIMFVVLFNYVFGSAIEIPGVDNYIDYLLAGIYAQATTFGSVQSGVALAEDLERGVIDRFRSLPMSRSAVLVGRTLADAGRGLFVVLLMTGVGYLIGFRFQNGALAAAGAIAVIVAFGFALTWVAAFVGMLMKGAEAAQAASFVWVFPLVFASSAFVPTDAMPAGLRMFADVNPVTAAVDAARVLMLGGPAARPVLAALAWVAGILVVFVPLCVRRYRRST